MPLPLPRSAGSLLPVRQPTLDVSAIYVRYVLLVHSSFLILITRFATLEGMKIKSVTPMHHPDEHGQFTNPRARRLEAGWQLSRP